MGIKRRVLLAKIGLDGHDRGILILAQALRNAGLEVIYSGLYQTPENIIGAALEEDVDMIGISTHIGSHVEIFSETLSLLKKTGEDRLVFGGGIIPQKDLPCLKKMGVEKIFLPGTDTKDIVNFVFKQLLSLKTKGDAVTDLFEKVKTGDILAAGRFITLIQEGNGEAIQLVEVLPGGRKKPLLVGVIGPGGAGKSTLIDKMIFCFRKKKKSVGVISCDPASVSGGTFLGDRIRMQKHTSDQAVFVRSVAQYEDFKGVTRETSHIIKVFEAMKKDVIIVETVGVGQKNLAFKDIVDTVVFIQTPEHGDEIQLLKGGVIETADIIVVNKSDRSGADEMLADIRKYFGTAKIFKTNSLTGEGIPELIKEIL